MSFMNETFAIDLLEALGLTYMTVPTNHMQDGVPILISKI